MEFIKTFWPLGSIVLLAILFIVLRSTYIQWRYRKAYANFFGTKYKYNPKTFGQYLDQYGNIQLFCTEAYDRYKKKSTTLRKTIWGWHCDYQRELYEGLFVQLHAIKTFACIRAVSGKVRSIEMPNDLDVMERERSFASQWDDIYQKDWLRNAVDKETIRVIAEYAASLCIQQLRVSCKNENLYQFNDTFSFIDTWATKSKDFSSVLGIVQGTIVLVSHQFLSNRGRFVRKKITDEYTSILSKTENKTPKEKAEALMPLLGLRLLSFKLFEAEKIYIRKEYDSCLACLYREEIGKNPAKALELFNQIETLEVKNDLLQPVTN